MSFSLNPSVFAPILTPSYGLAVSVQLEIYSNLNAELAFAFAN
jgi:hypothetical protein